MILSENIRVVGITANEERCRYLVENSEKGLQKGMEEFLEGKVKPLNISFTEYNQSIVKQFEELIGVPNTK